MHRTTVLLSTEADRRHMPRAVMSFTFYFVKRIETYSIIRTVRAKLVLGTV